MEIKDLKTGMKAVLRNGDERYTIAEFESFFLYEEEKDCKLEPTFDSYDDNLRNLNTSAFDILEVWYGEDLKWKSKL